MSASENAARAMPDAASDVQTNSQGALDWVGMGAIEMPVRLDDGADGVRMPARIDVFVNLLDGRSRGIHMSRLYLEIDRVLSAEPLKPYVLRRLLRGFLDSHAGLSDRAMLRLRFDLPLRRAALRSDHSGWKSYPVEISASMLDGELNLELAFELLYSSTCPCSAALARQLIQQRFQQDFPPGRELDRTRLLAWLGSEQGICATPHAQRSLASVRAHLGSGAKSGFGFPISDLIDGTEAALATPVQTAVKREDEQAFAGLNGANPMFCEDAARRIRQALESDERVRDFHIRATHMESLHPHDAVAIVTKGVAGGYAADSSATVMRAKP